MRFSINHNNRSKVSTLIIFFYLQFLKLNNSRPVFYGIFYYLFKTNFFLFWTGFVGND